MAWFAPLLHACMPPHCAEDIAVCNKDSFKGDIDIDIVIDIDVDTDHLSYCQVNFLTTPFPNEEDPCPDGLPEM